MLVFKNNLSFKIVKLVSLEGVATVFSVVLSILIARQFGVDFKGHLSQLKLFGGLVYLFLFSGLRYRVLQSNDVDFNRILNGIVLLGFLIVIPLLSFSLLFGGSLQIHVLYAFFFLLAEIIYVIKVKYLQVRKATLYSISPTFILIFLIVGFPRLITPVTVALFPYVVAVILFIIVERERVGFLKLGGVQDMLKNFLVYYKKEGLAQMTLSVVNAIPGYVPLLFLSFNVRELGFFSLAAGFNLIVLKLTRIIGIVSYRNELTDRLFTRDILGFTIVILIVTILIIPFLEKLIILVYGPSFTQSVVSSEILLLSAIFLPLNSKFEALCISRKHYRFFLGISLVLLLVYLPLFYIKVTSYNVAVALGVYRLLFFVFAAGSYHFYLKLNEDL